MNDTVTASTFWVWTDKAEKDNPQRSKAGDPIWPHYKEKAPAFMLKDGLIIDSSKYAKEGQLSIFDLI
ncbi:hypothetical protein J2T13_000854 [Paenibacillus sp. DS2015]|uniref:hypothetical protein n=1 Tax=Paenibacillus sp. DS2015 TaxID=3373917 RepID=UPI003D227819